MAAMEGILVRVRSQLGMWRVSNVDPHDACGVLMKRIDVEHNVSADADADAKAATTPQRRRRYCCRQRRRRRRRRLQYCICVRAPATAAAAAAATTSPSNARLFCHDSPTTRFATTADAAAAATATTFVPMDPRSRCISSSCRLILRAAML